MAQFPRFKVDEQIDEPDRDAPQEPRLAAVCDNGVVADHGTTITGSVARLTSLCDTLPSRSRSTKSGAALAHDDHVGRLLLGDVDDRLCDVAGAGFELDLVGAGGARALPRLRQGFGRQRLQQILQPDLFGLRELHHRLLGEAVPADDIGDEQVGPFALGQAGSVIDRMVRSFRPVGRSQNPPLHRSLPLLAQM